MPLKPHIEDDFLDNRFASTCSFVGVKFHKVAYYWSLVWENEIISNLRFYQI